MRVQHHTRREGTFDQWLADCSTWWDLIRGDEVFDFPELEWRAWYEEGLTVEAAVKRAEGRIYG
ncbi:MAG: hypothetical protein A2W00_02720 [Candidatus Eisenbacteria bacterium RBG_16_71_46]|nr:MAG: hypothetical protein A2W00_02720 [Candidatus Eisenbacteria bacterium RBG_16_71_46]OGF22400.1 MAG: hypothetical protein A2V63_10040 [Candidatus Eisenbacteria bacterium RBG_19FT_COMBO_70_11]